MYQKLETYIKSAADDLNISLLAYLPGEHEREKCRGIVQLVHGMSEYKERYIPLMEFLAEHEYASVIHDHRGHGKSVKDVKDLGYMYEVEMAGFMSDVLLVNQWAHERGPELPVFMLGHSMGSLAARVFLRRHDDCISKLILSGPPSKNPAVNMGLMMANMQKKIKGSKSPGRFLEKLSFGSYATSFKEEGNPFAWLNSDEKEVLKYQEDPLCGFVFTADGYQTLMQLLKTTYETSGWTMKNPELPILFLGGEDDPCIGGKDKFEEEMQALIAAGYTNVTGKLYEQMRHEICNEPEHLKVFEDILNFFEQE